MVLEGVDSAALHPDGKTLAFERGRKLWIGSLKGGEAKEFWHGPTNGGLSFSPDGLKLAVTASDPVLALTVSLRHAATARRPGLVTTPPSWFPDNRHLAVAARSDTGDSVHAL